MFFQHTKPVLITATLIGIGIWLLGFGWTRVRADRLLDQHSATTEGRVTDGWISTGSRGGKWSTLVVEYVLPLHAPITRKFDVNATTYETGLATRKVTVTYLPEDPRISRVTRFETLPFQLLIGLGAAILLSGFFCLWHFLKSLSKSTSAGQPG